jgi:hypothetical protein
VSLSAFLTDLGAHIAGNGGGTLGSSLFLAQFPASLTPATVASILTETQGQQRDDPRGLEYPRVQIVTRCDSYATARARAYFLYDLLNLPQQPVDIGSLAVVCTALQPPFALGLDERSCWRFSCNYQFTAA